MKGNKLTAWIIVIVTALVPLRIAFFNDESENIGLKILMMVLTIAGAVSAVMIGADKSGAH